MAEVLLLHHAQGLTPGVVALADRLIAAGHVVHTPDIYDGHTFDELSDGLAYLGTIGFQTAQDRGLATAEGLPDDLVYIGLSLAARELVRDAGAELFLYPGDGHLFVDSSLRDYDEDATELFLERVLGLLQRVE
jgi:dienelactone hydrolase